MINCVKSYSVGLLSILFYACQSSATGSLPILGNTEIVETTSVSGEKVLDTIYHTIPKFSFIDQDSNIVSSESLRGKIYVADFFFTRCPTICPILAKNLLKISKKFIHVKNFHLVSHSIDSKHDTPEVLRAYAQKLGAPVLWRFINGPQQEVYAIAGEKGYFSFAQQDSSAPGGFNHSGACSLVDGRGRVRAVYDGTDEKQIEELMDDIEQLLLEEGNVD